MEEGLKQKKIKIKPEFAGKPLCSAHGEQADDMRETKTTQLIAKHWLLLLQAWYGRQGHYFMGPLPHTQEKQEKLAQDCIHHCLSMTETKLISQEDASGTP